MNNVIGIGTDIIECLRIADMIEKHDDLFLQRVYTSSEIEYCSGRKASTQHYAGRWAAKEAILKSMGTGWAKGIHWTDIEITNAMGGKPSVQLHGAAREWCDKIGIGEILISISHCNSHATAFATAVSATEGSEMTPTAEDLSDE
jgi:holo-[acyl-carrier protein] synthase